MQDVLNPVGGWYNCPERLKIPNSKRAKYFFQFSSVLAKRFGRTEVPDVFKLLALHPSLFFPWLHFASKMMPYGKLAARERELVILRVAWLCKCRYEWGQHIEIGQQVAKLTDEDIIKISRGSVAFENKQEFYLLKACEELLADKVISSPTWDFLSNRYSDKLMVEILLLIGHYEMLAGLINSSGLMLDTDMEENMQQFTARVKNLISH
ncbi:MAG TPA: carboxymuconolactone decarboxylase family protein [Chitinophagales bacterium]|nr:carboxymuconolactone decarboxylase family protein [Chitinophagales bacterium]